ncbi:hypothetical protein D9758_009294 [Tetrapyrgos nigripes]|uniref:Uncharacterized protein n=1 Tax=Tetrapyrgos nigripes TaxID=182062 RepID=A0A8H5GHE5_9AGAR|nr:hypothetical protein D9758_009294 [Tetrapyrgos nigripes]
MEDHRHQPPPRPTSLLQDDDEDDDLFGLGLVDLQLAMPTKEEERVMEGEHYHVGRDENLPPAIRADSPLEGFYDPLVPASLPPMTFASGRAEEEDDSSGRDSDEELASRKIFDLGVETEEEEELDLEVTNTSSTPSLTRSLSRSRHPSMVSFANYHLPMMNAVPSPTSYSPVIPSTLPLTPSVSPLVERFHHSPLTPTFHPSYHSHPHPVTTTVRRYASAGNLIQNASASTSGSRDPDSSQLEIELCYTPDIGVDDPLPSPLPSMWPHTLRRGRGRAASASVVPSATVSTATSGLPAIPYSYTASPITNAANLSVSTPMHTPSSSVDQPNVSEDLTASQRNRNAVYLGHVDALDSEEVRKRLEGLQHQYQDEDEGGLGLGSQVDTRDNFSHTPTRKHKHRSNFGRKATPSSTVSVSVDLGSGPGIGVGLGPGSDPFSPGPVVQESELEKEPEPASHWSPSSSIDHLPDSHSHGQSAKLKEKEKEKDWKNSLPRPSAPPPTPANVIAFFGFEKDKEREKEELGSPSSGKRERDLLSSPGKDEKEKERQKDRDGKEKDPSTPGKKRKSLLSSMSYLHTLSLGMSLSKDRDREKDKEKARRASSSAPASAAASVPTTPLAMPTLAASTTLSVAAPASALAATSSAPATTLATPTTPMAPLPPLAITMTPSMDKEKALPPTPTRTSSALSDVKGERLSVIVSNDGSGSGSGSERLSGSGASSNRGSVGHGDAEAPKIDVTARTDEEGRDEGQASSSSFLPSSPLPTSSFKKGSRASQSSYGAGHVSPTPASDFVATNTDFSVSSAPELLPHSGPSYGVSALGSSSTTLTTMSTSTSGHANASVGFAGSSTSSAATHSPPHSSKPASPTPSTNRTKKRISKIPSIPTIPSSPPISPTQSTYGPAVGSTVTTSSMSAASPTAIHIPPTPASLASISIASSSSTPTLSSNTPLSATSPVDSLAAPTFPTSGSAASSITSLGSIGSLVPSDFYSVSASATHQSHSPRPFPFGSMGSLGSVSSLDPGSTSSSPISPASPKRLKKRQRLASLLARMAGGAAGSSASLASSSSIASPLMQSPLLGNNTIASGSGSTSASAPASGSTPSSASLSSGHGSGSGSPQLGYPSVSVVPAAAESSNTRGKTESKTEEGMKRRYQVVSVIPGGKIEPARYPGSVSGHEKPERSEDDVGVQVTTSWKEKEKSVKRKSKTKSPAHALMRKVSGSGSKRDYESQPSVDAKRDDVKDVDVFVRYVSDVESDADTKGRAKVSKDQKKNKGPTKLMNRADSPVSVSRSMLEFRKEGFEGIGSDDESLQLGGSLGSPDSMSSRAKELDDEAEDDGESETETEKEDASKGHAKPDSRVFLLPSSNAPSTSDLTSQNVSGVTSRASSRASVNASAKAVAADGPSSPVSSPSAQATPTSRRPKSKSPTSATSSPITPSRLPPIPPVPTVPPPLPPALHPLDTHASRPKLLRSESQSSLLTPSSSGHGRTSNHRGSQQIPPLPSSPAAPVSPPPEQQTQVQPQARNRTRSFTASLPSLWKKTPPVENDSVPPTPPPLSTPILRSRPSTDDLQGSTAAPVSAHYPSPVTPSVLPNSGPSSPTKSRFFGSDGEKAAQNEVSSSRGRGIRMTMSGLVSRLASREREKPPSGSLNLVGNSKEPSPTSLNSSSVKGSLGSMLALATSPSLLSSQFKASSEKDLPRASTSSLVRVSPVPSITSVGMVTLPANSPLRASAVRAEEEDEDAWEDQEDYELGIQTPAHSRPGSRSQSRSQHLHPHAASRMHMYNSSTSSTSSGGSGVPTPSSGSLGRRSRLSGGSARGFSVGGHTGNSFTTKGKKRKLVVSGIGKEDETALGAVKTWCESFGQVKHIARRPNGDLHVDFKRASVAETVCRVKAGVYIRGAGSVELSWYR